MLRVLIGSQPVRTGWLGGATASTAAHGALIALAVVSSSVPSTNVMETRAATPERITYVMTVPLPRPAPAPRAEVASNARVTTHHAAPVPDLSIAQNAIATFRMPDMAAPDLTAVTDGWLAMPDSIGADSTSTSLAEALLDKGGMVRPANGVFTEQMVERSVQARNGNPKPRYPATLADLGIEGDFVVRFVVDSTGAVDDGHIEFPEAMHRLFVDAVRSALRRSRYLPAMFAGRAVPQLVVQEFRFTVPGRR